jgi:hypothetical protein
VATHLVMVSLLMENQYRSTLECSYVIIVKECFNLGILQGSSIAATYHELGPSILFK